MARLFGLLALTGLLALMQAGSAAADKRVALVIGNGAYAEKSMRLANPPADALLVAAALGQLGFEVETVADASKESMEDAVERFAARSRDADVSLFYYAGHALQDLGKNYLMPVDGFLKSEQDLRRRFVRLDDVLADLSAVKGARIVILDACRDNAAVEALRAAVPKTRSADMPRGLAVVPKVSGMLVAFATQPDRVAADGTGTNSPFAEALARRIVEPGIELRTALTRVRQDVATATASRQIPEVSDSLLGELYLGRGAPALPPAAAAPPGTGDGSVEPMYWSTVERMGTRNGYESYLRQFGKSGTFASLAEEKIAALDKAAVPAATPPSAAAPARPAAAAANAPPPEWRKTCNTDPASKKEMCATTRSIVSDTGEMIASIGLREGQGSKRRHVVFVVPPDIQRQQGARVILDELRPLTAKFKMCLPKLCFAEIEIKDDFLAGLKNGKGIILHATSKEGTPILFPFALAGFAEAYAGQPRAVSKADGAPAPN